MGSLTKSTSMKSVLVVLSFLCCSALAVNQASLLDQFNEFKTRFSKVYPNQEEVKRFNIFTENVLKAEVHNKQEDSLYTRGVNMFSDMIQEDDPRRVQCQYQDK